MIIWHQSNIPDAPTSYFPGKIAFRFLHAILFITRLRNPRPVNQYQRQTPCRAAPSHHTALFLPYISDYFDWIPEIPFVLVHPIFMDMAESSKQASIKVKTKTPAIQMRTLSGEGKSTSVFWYIRWLVLTRTDPESTRRFVRLRPGKFGCGSHPCPGHQP